MINYLSIESFSELFWASVNSFSDSCRKIIEQTDFRYQVLHHDEYESVVLESLKKLDNGKFNIAGREKKERWEKGWDENYQNFIKEDFDINELVPKYYRPGQVMRLLGQFIKSPNESFEYDFFKVLRLWIFEKYLKEANAIYEFGCGPGHNLVELAKLFPDKRIYGLDWTDASVKILEKIAIKYNFNITGKLFDMFCPDKKFEFDENCIVVTFGSLEQIGDKYHNFLDFLIEKTPYLCINVEPFCELYNEECLSDYLAIRHHKMRGLLGNFLTKLKSLEKDGLIEIKKIQRLRFGSCLEEGWNFVVWRALK